MLNRKFLSAACVALTVGLLFPSKGSATILDLGTFNNSLATYRTEAHGISSDGTTIIGYGWSLPAVNHSFAINYAKSTNTYDLIRDIGIPAADSTLESFAYGVSMDGSIVVGSCGVFAPVSQPQHAFVFTYDKITNTAVRMTPLGSLSGNANYQSAAFGVSADGTVIVGQSFINPTDYSYFYHAFVVTYDKDTDTPGTMIDITPGIDGFSTACGISADASVIIGYGVIGTKLSAFAMNYDKGTNTPDSVVNLGLLDANHIWSIANGVSADGTVIVGDSHSNPGNISHGFVIPYNKTTKTPGTMIGLGAFGSSTNESFAKAISGDGSVIVGYANNGTATRAFAIPYNKTNNTLGLMKELETLGSDTVASYAYGVSADGAVIVGYSYNGTANHAVVWTDVFKEDAITLDATEWMASVSGPASNLGIVSSLSSQPMEGAHHRPLMSLDMMGKTSQSWITGDFGTRSRTSNSNTTSGEAGASRTFGDVVAGVAVGYGEQNNNLLFGGSSHVSGQYILSEIDTKLPDDESIVSLTATFGNWKSSTHRGYGIQNSLTDYSQGSTNVNSLGVRLRVDGPSYKFIDGPSLTAFASFTWSRTTADAYDETGGSFDAHFNDQKHISREGRLGLSSKFALSPDTTLLATAEWIHRFDKSESGFSGTDIDHSALPFDVAGAAITANQARFGFDVDHKLTPDTMLNFSAHFAGVGPSADVSGALSIRRAF